MNIEYVNLENGKSIVTNENGEMSISETPLSSGKLLVQNKIENIDMQIEQTEKKIKYYEESLFFVKYILILYHPLAIVLGSLLGYAINRFYGLIYALIMSITACGANALFWGITCPIIKKRLKGYNAELEKAGDLRKVFQEELEKAKEKKEETVKNIPVSLKNKNSFAFAQIDKDLNEAYYDAVHSKVKKLTLKK